MFKNRSKHRLHRLIELGRSAQKALRWIEDQEALKKDRSLIGRCFLYTNSFGSGKPWPLYLLVIGIDSYGIPRVVSFQRREDGQSELLLNDACLILDSARAISRFEFDLALKEFGAYIDSRYPTILEQFLCTKTSSVTP